MPAPLSATHQKTESSFERQEQIRRRAHELYEKRGRVDGFASDDGFLGEPAIGSSTSSMLDVSVAFFGSAGVAVGAFDPANLYIKIRSP
jgi:hypothetical protein